MCATCHSTIVRFWSRSDSFLTVWLDSLFSISYTDELVVAITNSEIELSVIALVSIDYSWSLEDEESIATAWSTESIYLIAVLCHLEILTDC